MSRALCAACALIGRRGYCAPGRCYCGHRTCHAYASWSPRPEPKMPDPEQPQPKRGPSYTYLAERDAAALEEA